MRLCQSVRSSALRVLRERGFVASETHPEETELVLSKPTKIYAGYDPTADGLHVGSLVTLMALAHLQRAGHTPVVLLGGATGLIGDPSGRETERSMLSETEAASNAAKVAGDAISLLLRATDPNGPRPVVVNNADWWTVKDKKLFEYVSLINQKGISSMSLLRDIGRHFRVPTMLRRESVSRRMESQEGKKKKKQTTNEKKETKQIWFSNFLCLQGYLSQNFRISFFSLTISIIFTKMLVLTCNWEDRINGATLLRG
jgi:tyrosyl-tRNA synthetase